MSKRPDSVRHVIRDELRKLRGQSPAPASTNKAKLLGLFLEEVLKNQGHSRRDFAQMLAIEAELADAILDGILPAESISDDFLEDIARAVGHQAGLLRTILERETTSGDPSSNVK